MASWLETLKWSIIQHWTTQRHVAAALLSSTHVWTHLHYSPQTAGACARAFTSDFWRVNNLLMWFDTNAACNRAHVQFHPCCQFWWDFIPLEDGDSTVFSLSSHNYCYCHHFVLIKTENHLHSCRLSTLFALITAAPEMFWPNQKHQACLTSFNDSFVFQQQ